MITATRFLQILHRREGGPPPDPDLFFDGIALTFDGVAMTFNP